MDEGGAEDALLVHMVGLDDPDSGRRWTKRSAKVGWKTRKKVIVTKRKIERMELDTKGPSTKRKNSESDPFDVKEFDAVRASEKQSTGRSDRFLGSTMEKTVGKKKEAGGRDSDPTQKARKKIKVEDIPKTIERRRPEVQLPRPLSDKEYPISDGATTFEQLGITEEIAEHLNQLGFKCPTGTQANMLPSILAGGDVMAKAPTGSGKTLGFLLPAVQMLASKATRVQRGEGTYSLVICPTRELCLQIWEVLALLLKKYHWIVGGMVMGGEKRNKEKARLRKGLNIVVGTPGRLKDHLENTSSWRLDNLQFLVLDEADRLLDLGFEETLSAILETLQKRIGNKNRWQSCLCSATLHSRLGSLAKTFLKNPSLLGFCSMDHPAGEHTHEADNPPLTWSGEMPCTDGEEKYSIPDTLEQFYVQVPSKFRFCALLAILHKFTKANKKILVFFNSCDGVEFASKVICQLVAGQAQGNRYTSLDTQVIALHGNLTQPERTRAFFKFTNCKTGVLLSTDVAARGLDFPKLDVSIQFDPPGDPAEYVHRIGRTARMGQKGKSVLFLLPSEQPYLQRLQHIGLELGKLDAIKLLDSLPGFPPSHGITYVDQHPASNAVLKQIQNSVATGKEARRLSTDAFGSYIRAYCTYPKALKDIFHVKNLHLGHVASSFGLREPPAIIGKSRSKQAMLQRKFEVVKSLQSRRRHTIK